MTGLFDRFFLISVLAVAFILSSSARAFPFPPPANGFDQGITVYWPYHVFFMVTGFILLGTGFYIARYHKTSRWYRNHLIFQTCGATSIITGLGIGVYMVALSGFPHLKNIHEILGVATGVMVIATLSLGYSIKRVNTQKNTVRFTHRWMGRTVLCLMIVTIAFGLFFLSLILRLQL